MLNFQGVTPFIPGTQMTLVFIRKGLVFGGWPSKIGVIGVLGAGPIGFMFWKLFVSKNICKELQPTLSSRGVSRLISMVIPYYSWWFQIFFIFTPAWQNDPIFPKAPKPPTSLDFPLLGCCLVTSKWATDDHFPLLNNEQRSNKVGVEHQTSLKRLAFCRYS